MKVKITGSLIEATVSAMEVAEFVDQWPGSSLEGPITFTFDGKNGDLVDISTDIDGEDVLALSQDAQDAIRKQIKGLHW